MDTGKHPLWERFGDDIGLIFHVPKSVPRKANWRLDSKCQKIVAVLQMSQGELVDIHTTEASR